MSISEAMKKDIGKHGSWSGNKVAIINSFSCYVGDFYIVKIEKTGKTIDINIWTEEGEEFIKTIE